MLNNHEIELMCRRVRYFIGVFPADGMPQNIVTPATLIVNTDPANETGEHWIAIHITDIHRADYFDPFGFPPLIPAMQQFLCRYKVIRYNARSIQDVNSTICGDFCICFVKCVADGHDLASFVQRFMNTILGGAETNKRLLSCVSELSS